MPLFDYFWAGFTLKIFWGWGFYLLISQIPATLSSSGSSDASVMRYIVI